MEIINPQNKTTLTPQLSDSSGVDLSKIIKELKEFDSSDGDDNDGALYNEVIENILPLLEKIETLNTGEVTSPEPLNIEAATISEI